MRTLKGKRETAPAPKAEEPKEAPNVTEETKTERVSFALNADGKIDFAGMRTSTREKLKVLIGDAEAQRELGIGAAPGAAAAMMFNPQMVSGMYDMLGAIEASVLPMFFPKIPADIFQRVFKYTPEEKEILTPPTVRILNKYVPDWLIKYQDEIALATTLASITWTKVQAAIVLSRIQPNVVEMPKAADAGTGTVQ